MYYRVSVTVKNTSHACILYEFTVKAKSEADAKEWARATMTLLGYAYSSQYDMTAVPADL